jgi:recombination protein RecR
MSVTPKAVERLIEALSRLPGIGPKTASRLTFFLLRAPKEQALELSEAVLQLRERVMHCSICHNITETDPCPICGSETRDHSLICVVEEPLDVLAIDRTNAYQGVYHVLGGVISPMEGVGPGDLRIKELIGRVEQGGIVEIIIATNPSLEGENTAMYLSRRLQPLGVRISRLARGLPVGADLEYADNLTLARAVEGRQEM